MQPRNFYTQGGMVHTGVPQPAVPVPVYSSAASPYKLDLPAVLPLVGEVVLFCIGPNLFRPLIIAAADSVTAKVSGLVILAADTDRSAPWCRKWMFSPPTKTLPIHYVENVLWGTEEGQWRRGVTTQTLTVYADPGENGGSSTSDNSAGVSSDPRMNDDEE